MAAACYLLFSYLCFAIIPQLNGLGCMIILVCFALIQALLNAALPAYMISKFNPAQRGKALALAYIPSLAIFGRLLPYLILTNKISPNPGIMITICAIVVLLNTYFNRRHHGNLRSEFIY